MAWEGLEPISIVIEHRSQPADVSVDICHNSPLRGNFLFRARTVVHKMPDRVLLGAAVVVDLHMHSVCDLCLLKG